MSTGIWPRLLLGLLLVGPLGCAGADRDFNPFYFGTVEDDPWTAESLSLGPLYDEARNPDGLRERALHPLFRYVRDDEQVRLQVLHPIFQWRQTDHLTEWRVLPLEWYRHYHPPHQDPEWDLMLLPLLFAGGGSAEERSFALLPFYGRIRAFAGFAEASFVLFPLYYQLKKNITGEETFHNITPLFGWIDGGPRDGSFRILPFYGQWLWEGKSEKYSALWPIVHWQRDRLDTESPSALFAVWPLFKVDSSDRHRFVTLLWPFFRWNVEESLEHGVGSDGEDRPGERYHLIDVLWPLYRSEKTREYERLRLFPFFSRYRSDELDSDAFAIPLLWRREIRAPDHTTRTFDLAPLFHREWTEYDDGRPPSSATRVWPLVGFEKDGLGGRTWTVPILSPIDIPRFTDDFVANWAPWFNLYRDERTAAGERHVEALLRTVQYRRTDQRTRWSLPFLYSGERRRQRTTHDLLLGAIRFGRGAGGAELRLFGLPILQPRRDSR